VKEWREEGAAEVLYPSTQCVNTRLKERRGERRRDVRANAPITRHPHRQNSHIPIRRNPMVDLTHAHVPKVPRPIDVSCGGGEGSVREGGFGLGGGGVGDELVPSEVVAVGTRRGLVGRKGKGGERERRTRCRQSCGSSSSSSRHWQRGTMLPSWLEFHFGAKHGSEIHH
jgi:hypothetical protein